MSRKTEQSGEERVAAWLWERDERRHEAEFSTPQRAWKDASAYERAEYERDAVSVASLLRQGPPDPDERHARDMFNVGDRVRLTADAVAWGVTVKTNEGTVTGFGTNGKTVRVLVDGTKWAQAYHMDFWRATATQNSPLPPDGSVPQSLGSPK